MSRCVDTLKQHVGDVGEKDLGVVIKTDVHLGGVWSNSDDNTITSPPTLPPCKEVSPKIVNEGVKEKEEGPVCYYLPPPTTVHKGGKCMNELTVHVHDSSTSVDSSVASNVVNDDVNVESTSYGFVGLDWYTSGYRAVGRSNYNGMGGYDNADGRGWMGKLGTETRVFKRGRLRYRDRYEYNGGRGYMRNIGMGETGVVGSLLIVGDMCEVEIERAR